MKRIALILGMLLIAQSAFAGGTVLFYNGGGYTDDLQYQQARQLDPNSTLYTADGVSGPSDATAGKTTTTRKFRLGRQSYNDPNVYWNFGRVNFGNGFTSVGGGDKKY